MCDLSTITGSIDHAHKGLTFTERCDDCGKVLSVRREVYDPPPPDLRPAHVIAGLTPPG